jgi:integrase
MEDAMSSNSAWKTYLQEILDEHNWKHGALDKSVAHKTRHDRIRTLFLCFRQIRALGYLPHPRGICNKHVQALVDYWVGKRELVNPRSADRYQEDSRPLAPGTIQTRLSYLRVYCEWIDKPGMIRPPEHYVDDPALVKRIGAAKRDKSWSGNAVDIEAIIDQVSAYDPYVGMQLTFCYEFGLRVKEAIMLRPHESDVGELMLPEIRPDSCRYLKVKRGTKGGRIRFIPIDTQEKVDLVERAKAFVRGNSNPLGNTKLELAQALRRFYYVMDKFGATKQMLSVTAHGLRHEYAHTNYAQLAGESAPIKSSAQTLKAAETLDARCQVAELLGHSRPQIVSAYIGSNRCPRNSQNKSDDSAK